MAGPWERYGGTASPAPSVIEGPPRQPAPRYPDEEVVGQNRAALAPTERALAEERLRGEQIQNRTRQRTAADPAGDASVEQRRAAGFYLRANRSNDMYERMGVGPRSLPGQVAADTFPNVTNYFTDPSRQQAEAAVRDFVAATLRYESGAAIPTEELENQRRIFFPAPGDSPETIAAKAQLRRNAIESLQLGGGQASGAVEVHQVPLTPEQGQAALSAVQSGIAAATGTPGAPIGPSEPPQPDDGELVVNIEGGRPPSSLEEASPEVLSAYADAKRSNPNLSFPDFVRGAFPRVGRGSGAYQPDISDRGSVSDRLVTGAMSLGVPTLAVPQLLGAVGLRPSESADAFTRGFQDIQSGGFRDELAATVNPNSDLRRERGIDDYDTENNFLARAGGQLAGGFALPGGAVTSLPRQMAIGTAYGAEYGLGSGRGTAGERFENALAGGAIGGVAPVALRGLGVGVNALRGRGGDASELVRAADRQGVNILPADVGGPATRRATSAVSQTFAGAGPIVRQAGRVNSSAGAARDRVAASVGTAREPEEAGEIARAGANSFIARTSGRGSELYERAERVAGDARIEPSTAQQVLDRNIAELADTPGGAEGLSALQALRAELNGEFSVAGLRRMRSTLRDKFISDGLRGSDLERRVGQVIDAAAQDVDQGLRAQGRGNAARAFQVADRYWRNRLQTIDNVLDPIIGNGQSGEQIVGALQRAGRGNARRLEAFVRALPTDEAATVRATLIGQLGRPSAGTATEETFSLNQFLTHWNQMTPRARRTVFQGDALAALEDLATVARGSRQAMTYANRSNTGGAIGNFATGASGILSLPLMGALLAGQYGAGRLLASPAFARWLAGAPRAGNPTAHVRSLTTIAARNPAIAQEVLGLQRMLANVANDNVSLGRVAASNEPGQDEQQR